MTEQKKRKKIYNIIGKEKKWMIEQAKRKKMDDKTEKKICNIRSFILLSYSCNCCFS